MATAMKITNKFGFPKALVDAVANDPYSKGDADYSATELIGPPRIRALKLKHESELVEDVSDRIWSLFGQITHLILERANKTGIAEKRYFCELMGKKISAQIDVLDDGVLTDYKTTTVWKFMSNKPIPPEYEQQMNIQRYLLSKNNIDVEKLQVVGLLRDWSESQMKRNKNYPSTNIAKMEIPIWTDRLTEEFIKQRIRLHELSLIRLPECTVDETWGGRRCATYCSVGNFCDQYQQTLIKRRVDL